jgi:DNA-binding NarL/FixJ family response regulator
LWAARRWLNAYVQKMSRVDSSTETDLARRLSRREREVFRYAATGMANKELAQRLAISEATVKVHLTRIFQKLGVSGRAELAAAYHGLRVPPNTPVVRRSA